MLEVGLSAVADVAMVLVIARRFGIHFALEKAFVCVTCSTDVESEIFRRFAL